jgi:hypothetical protein
MRTGNIHLTVAQAGQPSLLFDEPPDELDIFGEADPLFPLYVSLCVCCVANSGLSVRGQVGGF